MVSQHARVVTSSADHAPAVRARIRRATHALALACAVGVAGPAGAEPPTGDASKIVVSPTSGSMDAPEDFVLSVDVRPMLSPTTRVLSTAFECSLSRPMGPGLQSVVLAMDSPESGVYRARPTAAVGRATVVVAFAATVQDGAAPPRTVLRTWWFLCGFGDLFGRKAGTAPELADLLESLRGGGKDRRPRTRAPSDDDDAGDPNVPSVPERADARPALGPPIAWDPAATLGSKSAALDLVDVFPTPEGGVTVLWGASPGEGHGSRFLWAATVHADGRATDAKPFGNFRLDAVEARATSDGRIWVLASPEGSASPDALLTSWRDGVWSPPEPVEGAEMGSGTFGRGSTSAHLQLGPGETPTVLALRSRTPAALTRTRLADGSWSPWTPVARELGPAEGALYGIDSTLVAPDGALTLVKSLGARDKAPFGDARLLPGAIHLYQPRSGAWAPPVHLAPSTFDPSTTLARVDAAGDATSVATSDGPEGARVVLRRFATHDAGPGFVMPKVVFRSEPFAEIPGPIALSFSRHGRGLLVFRATELGSKDMTLWASLRTEDGAWQEATRVCGGPSGGDPSTKDDAHLRDESLLAFVRAAGAAVLWESNAGAHRLRRWSPTAGWSAIETIAPDEDTPGGWTVAAEFDRSGRIVVAHPDVQGRVVVRRGR